MAAYDILTIIGNGFDIHCGLHTRYIDYFNYQKEKNLFYTRFINNLKRKATKSFEKMFGTFPKNSSITFFDIYFSVQDYLYDRLDTPSTWADIEEMLLRGIKQKSSFDLQFEMCFRTYKFLIDENTNKNYREYQKYLLIGYYLKKIFNAKELNGTQFYNYLKNELQAFSVNFSRYVNNEVEQNQNYKIQAKELLNKICPWGLEQMRILSFNYTRPINNWPLVNIHGQADKENIIFGVSCGNSDKEKIEMHSSFYYEMTKEFKSANAAANGMILSTFYEPRVREIYIYGSSLGKQDYDFFDTLLDVYGFFAKKNTPIIFFCFSFYEGRTKEEISNEVSSQITKLINTLGDNHGIPNLFRYLFQTQSLVIKPVEE